MGKKVTAVVTTEGRCVGAVGPFDVSVGWWAEVEPVVAHLEDVLGVPAYVLRLLRVERGDGSRGGHVTYHVEAPGTTATLPTARPPDDEHPLRAHWASPDGLLTLFAWARETLATQGIAVTGPIRQRRTWNLAGLFVVPTATGPVWLKALPAFAADEAHVIEAFAQIDPTLVPKVLGSAPGRLLLANVPGEDCWTAPPDVLANGIRRFVTAQARLAEPPPWLTNRADPEEEARALLARDLGLTTEERTRAEALLGRWQALSDCGLPNTVVHGDFHCGNWRSDAGGPPVVLDFADAHFGHPVVDGLRVTNFRDPATRPAADEAWASAWRAARPGCDPERALSLGEPLARLYHAVRYQEFLDGIEDSERIYHAGDPAGAVRAALAVA